MRSTVSQSHSLRTSHTPTNKNAITIYPTHHSQTIQHNRPEASITVLLQLQLQSSVLILILRRFLDTTQTPRPTGRNETHLASGRTFPSDRTGHANVLVISTTVRMLHRILGHTPNLGPAVAFDGVLVVGASGLEQGLVGAAAASDNANLRADGTGDRLFATTGETQTRRALVFVVCHNHGKGTAAAGKGPAVTEFGFDIADNGAFWDCRQGQDVAYSETGFFAAINELSRVHAFGTHEQFVVALVAVGVAELDLGDGGAAPGIVEDFLDDAANVPMLFGIIEGTQLDRFLASPSVRLENGGLSPALGLKREREREEWREVRTRRMGDLHASLLILNSST